MGQLLANWACGSTRSRACWLFSCSGIEPGDNGSESLLFSDVIAACAHEVHVGCWPKELVEGCALKFCEMRRLVVYRIQPKRVPAFRMFRSSQTSATGWSCTSCRAFFHLILWYLILFRMADEDVALAQNERRHENQHGGDAAQDDRSAGARPKAHSHETGTQPARVLPYFITDDDTANDLGALRFYTHFKITLHTMNTQTRDATSDTLASHVRCRQKKLARRVTQSIRPSVRSRRLQRRRAGSRTEHVA